MSIDDLGKLPFEAVIPLSKRMAVGSPPDWGDKIGIGMNVINRAFSSWQDDREYFITFAKVPELCVAMRSSLLIQWAMARYEYLSREMDMPARPMDTAGCLRACAKMMKEMGDVAKEIEAAAEDEQLSKQEIRRIQRELSDVISICFNCMGQLNSALDEHYKEGRTRSGHS